jgi:hypothetical protein
VIPHHRRQRALTITPAGARLPADLEAGAQRLRDRLLAPPAPAERRTFMALLTKLVDGNNAQSRVPLARPGSADARPGPGGPIPARY